MSAVIRRFRGRPERLRQDESARVRAVLVPFVEDGFSSPQLSAAAGRLIAVLDGETASVNRWSFVMLSPAQNASVVEYLVAHSERPFVAVRVWALCFEHLRMDTGEIVLGREEIAAKLGVSARDVSRVVSELVECGALSRVRERVAGVRGRGVVRYFMNPSVATHLSGKARDDAQAAAPRLGVVELSERRPRRRWRGAAPVLL